MFPCVIAFLFIVAPPLVNAVREDGGHENWAASTHSSREVASAPKDKGTCLKEDPDADGAYTCPAEMSRGLKYASACTDVAECNKNCCRKSLGANHVADFLLEECDCDASVNCAHMVEKLYDHAQQQAPANVASAAEFDAWLKRNPAQLGALVDARGNTLHQSKTQSEWAVEHLRFYKNSMEAEVAKEKEGTAVGDNLGGMPELVRARSSTRKSNAAPFIVYAGRDMNVMFQVFCESDQYRDLCDEMGRAIDHATAPCWSYLRAQADEHEEITVDAATCLIMSAEMVKGSDSDDGGYGDNSQFNYRTFAEIISKDARNVCPNAEHPGGTPPRKGAFVGCKEGTREVMGYQQAQVSRQSNGLACIEYGDSFEFDIKGSKKLGEANDEKVGRVTDLTCNQSTMQKIDGVADRNNSIRIKTGSLVVSHNTGNGGPEAPYRPGNLSGHGGSADVLNELESAHTAYNATFLVPTMHEVKFPNAWDTDTLNEAAGDRMPNFDWWENVWMHRESMPFLTKLCLGRTKVFEDACKPPELYKARVKKGKIDKDAIGNMAKIHYKELVETKKIISTTIGDWKFQVGSIFQHIPHPKTMFRACPEADGSWEGCREDCAMKTITGLFRHPNNVSDAGFIVQNDTKDLLTVKPQWTFINGISGSAWEFANIIENFCDLWEVNEDLFYDSKYHKRAFMRICNPIRQCLTSSFFSPLYTKALQIKLGKAKEIKEASITKEVLQNLVAEESYSLHNDAGAKRFNCTKTEKGYEVKVLSGESGGNSLQDGDYITTIKTNQGVFNEDLCTKLFASEDSKEEYSITVLRVSGIEKYVHMSFDGTLVNWDAQFDTDLNAAGVKKGITKIESVTICQWTIDSLVLKNTRETELAPALARCEDTKFAATVWDIGEYKFAGTVQEELIAKPRTPDKREDYITEQMLSEFKVKIHRVIPKSTGDENVIIDASLSAGKWYRLYPGDKITLDVSGAPTEGTLNEAPGGANQKYGLNISSADEATFRDTGCEDVTDCCDVGKSKGEMMKLHAAALVAAGMHSLEEVVAGALASGYDSNYIPRYWEAVKRGRKRWPAQKFKPETYNDAELQALHTQVIDDVSAAIKNLAEEDHIKAKSIKISVDGNAPP